MTGASSLQPSAANEGCGYADEGEDVVRIHTGRGRDTDTDVYQNRRNYVWDNRSDTDTLRNDHRRFIDDESWGPNRHGGRLGCIQSVRSETCIARE